MHNKGIIYIYMCGNIHYEGVGGLFIEEMLSENSQLRTKAAVEIASAVFRGRGYDEKMPIAQPRSLDLGFRVYGLGFSGFRI